MNQVAISTPVLLQKLRAEYDTRTREFPFNTSYQGKLLCERMRHQVGIYEDVTEYEPVYKGKRLIGRRKTGRTVSAFRLLGHGETLKAAQAMARGDK